MKTLRPLAFMAIAAGILLAPAHKADAQVSVSIGAPPVCPYGYYEVPPYNCAPDGYYGPEWFSGGVFIGAGPWFHGPHGFYGHVDNRWDPHYGYHGPLPERGAQPFQHFQANEARDGQGHIGNAGHDGGGEHSAGFVGGGHPGGHR